MLKQNNISDINIKKYGCYFLCLLFLVEKRLNREMREQEILEIYIDSVKKEFIKENCYILKPDELLNYSFRYFNLRYKAKSELINLPNATDFIAKMITHYQTVHFVVIDKDDKIIFDADNFLEQQNKKKNIYKLVSKRCFKIWAI